MASLEKMAVERNQFPKLHNAMWPGLVGKGAGGEPGIELETMLRLTSEASVNGTRFDGVDLFLADPHVSIDSTPADLETLAKKIRERDLAVGSLVAPVWSATGGGSAMGSADERKHFLEQVHKACHIGRILRETGVRPYGVIRIDSAAATNDWYDAPASNTEKIIETFRAACDIARRARRAAGCGRRDLLGRDA